MFRAGILFVLAEPGRPNHWIERAYLLIFAPESS
jgi:hypothetical protein